MRVIAISSCISRCCSANAASAQGRSRRAARRRRGASTPEMLEDPPEAGAAHRRLAGDCQSGRRPRVKAPPRRLFAMGAEQPRRALLATIVGWGGPGRPAGGETAAAADALSRPALVWRPGRSGAAPNPALQESGVERYWQLTRVIGCALRRAGSPVGVVRRPSTAAGMRRQTGSAMIMMGRYCRDDSTTLRHAPGGC